MRAIVVAGGSTDPADATHLTDADLVVAADGGAAWLVAVGHTPDLLVGDMDSIPAALLEQLGRDGVTVERHRADKEASDLELALDASVRAGASELTILGALGGPRLDHELANLLLLADPGWAALGLIVRIVRGPTAVRALHGPGAASLTGLPGGGVTLLPVGGDALGVSTAGLRFPLNDEPLRMGRSRGLSNVVETSPARVALVSGTLLIIEGDAS
jgi:thiamine pyrophosphokinase